MTDFEYGNDANGCCQECGEPTDEEWHAYCAHCFAEQQGWRQRNVYNPLEHQHADREQVSLLSALERVGELERRVARLELAAAPTAELLASLARRVERLELGRPAA